MCDSAKCGCGGTCGGDSTSAKVKKALGATKPRACVGSCGSYADSGSEFCMECMARHTRLSAREWPDLTKADQKWLDGTDRRLAQRSKRGAR